MSQRVHHLFRFSPLCLETAFTQKQLRHHLRKFGLLHQQLRHHFAVLFRAPFPWSLCSALALLQSGTVVIRASLPPPGRHQFQTNTNHNIRESREWVAVGGYRALGGDVSGNFAPRSKQDATCHRGANNNATNQTIHQRHSSSVCALQARASTDFLAQPKTEPQVQAIKVHFCALTGKSSVIAHMDTLMHHAGHAGPCL